MNLVSIGCVRPISYSCTEIGCCICIFGQKKLYELLYSGGNVNILLIGAADLRHVLLTIANNNNLFYKHIHVSNIRVLGC